MYDLKKKKKYETFKRFYTPVVWQPHLKHAGSEEYDKVELDE